MNAEYVRFWMAPQTLGRIQLAQEEGFSRLDFQVRVDQPDDFYTVEVQVQIDSSEDA